MWSSKMFAGWALILLIAIAIDLIVKKEYWELAPLFVVVAFILISQRNVK